MSKSKNHKFYDDYCEEEEKTYVMSQRREAKKDKLRKRIDLLGTSTALEDEPRELWRDPEARAIHIKKFKD